MTDLAIVALTPRGLDLGRRLAAALGHGAVVSASGTTRETLTTLFQAGRPLVCVMALGIVVRTLGPIVGSKQTDPPVVVVDEAGTFAISVLGGHQAGANALARRVADALGGTAVITTASDTHGLPAVDLIGKSLGWDIDNPGSLTAVAAAVVRGALVGVYQEAGSSDWWQEFGDWPASFHRLAAWPPTDAWAATLFISDRLHPEATVPTVIYRPKVLVVGVGCRRGVPAQEIAEAFLAMMDRAAYSPRCVAAVATVTLKGNEPGLQEFARRLGVPLLCFPPAELEGVAGVQSSSAVVRAKIGIPAVAEPAALVAAASSVLLVPKQRSARVTVALARKKEP